MGIDLINNCMKIEQLSEILDKQVAKGGAVNNVERMSNAIRKVMTEDAKLMSQGKDAYETARRRDFERKIAEDYKNPRKMTFTEMVNRYL
jgi:isoaspartyl peptidase/L-asparaginase-like protein (Ntn-hydrolase superfamily)